jgi:hypothetical protein
VLLWNETTQQATECKRVHESSIVFTTWTIDGSRLITGDEARHRQPRVKRGHPRPPAPLTLPRVCLATQDGLVCIWLVSQSGTASLANEIRRDRALIHCTVPSFFEETASSGKPPTPLLSACQAAP